MAKKMLVYVLTSDAPSGNPYGPDTIWTQIGDAYLLDNGDLSVELVASPLSGRLRIVSEPRERVVSSSPGHAHA